MIANGTGYILIWQGDEPGDCGWFVSLPYTQSAEWFETQAAARAWAETYAFENGGIIKTAAPPPAVLDLSGPPNEDWLKDPAGRQAEMDLHDQLGGAQ